jgi:putative membrane protein
MSDPNDPQMSPQARVVFDWRRLLLRWAITSIAVFAAVWLIPGITFEGRGWEIGIVAIILGLLNAVIRPLLVFFTCPLVLLTFGLFTLVINALLLGLTSALADQLGIAFHVDSFWDALFGGIVISLVSTLLNWLAGENRVHVYVHRGDEQQ